jgi:hypothetical protein
MLKFSFSGERPENEKSSATSWQKNSSATNNNQSIKIRLLDKIHRYELHSANCPPGLIVFDLPPTSGASQKKK